ncbi:MAG: heavy metal translocating P-type ATPase, partial [Planctomycetaceae bacterium]
RLQSSAALSALEKLLPENVSIIRSGIDTTVPLSDVVVGDRLRVRPAERIPIDGRVENGTSTVDQQIVTGESWPVVCRPGDVLYGGTLNLDGEFVLQATAPAGEGVFRKLIEAVQSARASKGRYEQLSERAASLFLPVVVVVSLATFGFHAWFHGWEQGILSGLSVVLIACPCALGIATPMAVWSALGRAVQEQVLFKSSDALERLANVDRIYFDKTGTLTTGTPALVGFVTANPQLRDDALRFAALAAVNSTHPLSRVILEFARSGDVTDSAVSEAVATANSSVSHPKTLVFPGRGIVVERSEHLPEIYLGSRRFLAGAGFRMNGFFEAQYESAMDHGNPVVLVAWDECVKGLFKFEEMTRAEARETIRECRSLDLKLLVLTGDHDSRASYLAAQLGLQVESELLPNDKMERVAAARTRGGLVAMVGDGVNDAPALAASDIGIALGCGADISRESADVCLLSNDLSRIPWTVRLARATVRTIRVNLFWAFAYNVVGIILAATGWLSPSLAALFMVLSSLFVIANSRRLGEFECDRSSNPIRTAVKPSEDHRAGEIASESSPVQPKADRSITRFESARMPQAVSIDQHSFTLPTPGRPC